MEALTLLRLLQLFDSQFPVGSFAHSFGLETYGQRGAGVGELKELLWAQLAQGGLRLDVVACALAWEKAQDLDTLEELGQALTAWRPVLLSYETSLKLGRRMLRILRRVFPEVALPPLSEPHQAVVVGAAGRGLGLPQEALCLAFAQSSLQSLLFAATRCMAVSPEQAQELLCHFQPGVVALVAEVLKDPWASFFSSTPAWDLRAHQQAFLETRLFQS